tara:strand:+ start:715 stop:999 length:285 start_codon:yes stop_codon:yes gene_type:complete
MSWKNILKTDKEELFRRLKNKQGENYGGDSKNFDEMMDNLTQEVGGKIVFKPENMNFKTRSEAKKFLRQWIKEQGFDVEPIEQDGEVRYYFVKQ